MGTWIKKLLPFPWVLSTVIVLPINSINSLDIFKTEPVFSIFEFSAPSLSKGSNRLIGCSGVKPALVSVIERKRIFLLFYDTR